MVTKADPGFAAELRPNGMASIVWDIDKYAGATMTGWLNARSEMFLSTHRHLWTPFGILCRRDGWQILTYQDLIDDPDPYVKDMGFTHIELLPVSEHPLTVPGPG